MTLNPILARRTALAAGLAGVGAVTLAACGSSSSPSSSTKKADSSAAASQPIAALDSIKVGDSASANVGDAKVLLYRTGADTVVCFSAVCTHQGCTVAPDGAKLACPCHGSTFDAKTGKVLQGPASQPLPAVAVKVANGQIVKA